MHNPLVLKLEHGADLTEADRARLLSVSAKTRRVDAHRDIVRAGDRPDDVLLVMGGFACRYKVLADGSRQILSYLVPGDFCDLHVTVLSRMDHSIATLSPCEVVDISPSTIEDLAANHPRIARALLWATLADAAVSREWLVNVAQRSAMQRIAHLFCEMHARLRTVGLVDDGQFELPLTQGELGQTVSLSTVHVNRTLQDLRGRGLIAFKAKAMHILDIERLTALAEFDADYLHLQGRPEEIRQAVA